MMPCSVSVCVCAVVVDGAVVAVVLSLPQPVLSAASASSARVGQIDRR
jgi:hypothetical protein